VKYSQILIYLLIVSCLVSCGENKKKKKNRTPTYPVVKAEIRDLTGYSTYPTNLEGVQNIEIRPKIQGFIEKIYVDEGEAVSEGQMLFQLEAQSLDAKAQAANDAIKTAEASAVAARLEVEKLKPLVEKKIIADVELETANTNLRSAQAKLEESRNSYKSIQQSVNYRNVTSPISGRVGKIPKRIGSLVGATDAVALTTVSNTSDIYAYFSMNEKAYVQFLKNTNGKNLEEKIANFPEIILRLSSGTEYGHRGKIEAIIDQVNPDTGSIQFRALFPNPEGLLASGYSGVIMIPEAYKEVLVVPEQSTFEDQTLIYVFKLAKADTLRKTQIEVKTRIDNYVIVENGIKKGDSILGKGLSQVRDGVKIKPKLIPLDSLAGAIDKLFKD